MHEDLEFSLKTLKDFSEDVPGIGNLPNRMLASSYDDFVITLYKDIDVIVAKMEENPELLKNDTEDRLTVDVKNQLCAMGYDAFHEAKIGGHADLVVKKQATNWTWIGEAKVHKNYKWLLKGFQQLTTRYTTGGYNNCQGGLLIYIRNANAKNVMEKWKDYLEKQNNIKGLKIIPCRVNPLSFYSKHNHQRSGSPFKIRHLPFILHFNPQDS